MKLLFKVFGTRSAGIDFFALDANPLNWFNTILSAIYFMAISLLVYALNDLYSEVLVLPIKGFSLYFLFFIGLVLYSLVKKFFGFLLGFVVEEYSKSKRYFLLKQLYSQLIGLTLIPLLIIYYYAPFSSALYLFGLIGFFLFVKVYGALRIAYLFVFELKYFSYQIFIYLCTLEILPVLVVVKFLMNHY